jgi:hypothetical protein
LLPPALWQGYAKASEAFKGAGATLPARCAMFSGTLSVQGELAAMTTGDSFEMELHDPVLKRSLRQRYSLHTLPVVA